jgi:type II protein arginine methyltransferase
MTDDSVVAVVGAGRGPLVDRALKAAESAGRQIELFAVEKNPHAFIGYTLLESC